MILLIPRMNFFIRLLMQQGTAVYIIAPTMSLSSFSKFNTDNFWTNHFDLLSYGYSKHGWFVGCKRCRANASNLESSEDHCNTCTYYRLNFEALPTDELLNITKMTQMVVNMYDKALAVVNGGIMVEHPPPPRDKYIRQEYDSYKLCQFTNEEDDEIFCKWLILYDTIEVSTI
jgi:hypothetical protein